jgi:hypothetical protein
MAGRAETAPSGISQRIQSEIVSKRNNSVSCVSFAKFVLLLMLVVDSDPALWRGTGSNSDVSSRGQSPRVRPRRSSISSTDFTSYSSSSSGITNVRPRRSSMNSADYTCYSSASSGTAVYFKAPVRDTPKGLRHFIPLFGSPTGKVMRGRVSTSSLGIDSPRRRMRKLKVPDLSNDDNYLSFESSADSETCNVDGVFPMKKALSRPIEDSSAHTEPTTSEEDDLCLSSSKQSPRRGRRRKSLTLPFVEPPTSEDDDFCLSSSKHSPRRRGRKSLALPFIESLTSEEDDVCLLASKESPRRRGRKKASVCPDDDRFTLPIVEPMTCKEDDVFLTPSKQSLRRRERKTAADRSEWPFVELMASEEEGVCHSQSKQSPRRWEPEKSADRADLAPRELHTSLSKLSPRRRPQLQKLCGSGRYCDLCSDNHSVISAIIASGERNGNYDHSGSSEKSFEKEISTSSPHGSPQMQRLYDGSGCFNNGMRSQEFEVSCSRFSPHLRPRIQTLFSTERRIDLASDDRSVSTAALTLGRSPPKSGKCVEFESLEPALSPSKRSSRETPQFQKTLSDRCFDRRRLASPGKTSHSKRLLSTLSPGKRNRNILSDVNDIPRRGLVQPPFL